MRNGRGVTVSSALPLFSVSDSVLGESREPFLRTRNSFWRRALVRSFGSVGRVPRGTDSGKANTDIVGSSVGNASHKVLYYHYLRRQETQGTGSESGTDGTE